MIKNTSSQDIIIEQKSKHQHRLKYVISFFLLAMIVALATSYIIRWSASGLSIDSQRVRIATVERGNFVRDLLLQGNIIAANSPKLYAPESGNVTLLFNPGDKVEKGTLVARVDSPELINRLQQEKAQLESMHIQLARKKIASKQTRIKSRQQIQLEKVILEAANREKQRAEKSLKMKALSRLDYEKSIDDLKRSQLKYDFAIETAELEKENQAFELKTQEFELNQYSLLVKNTQRLVSELNITAPVSGIIGAWLVEQKAAVATNQALMTVVDLSAFQVEVDIPESYADDIGIGMQVNVNYNGQKYGASVISIAPEVENSVVKGRVSFTTKTPSGLKQNQRVSGQVILEKKDNILFIPRGTFVQHHGGLKAFVINNEIASLTDINLGARSIDKIEVTGGLKEGQQIIISNTSFVEEAKTLSLY